MNQGKKSKENAVLAYSNEILAVNLFMMHSSSSQQMTDIFILLCSLIYAEDSKSLI